MINRKWLGDIGLAVLLALPTAALTRPAAHDTPRRPATTASSMRLAPADTLQQRFTLPR